MTKKQEDDAKTSPLSVTVHEPEADHRTSNVSDALYAVAGLDATDPDDERGREAMRDIDAHRPHRPLFEGMY